MNQQEKKELIAVYTALLGAPQRDINVVVYEAMPDTEARLKTIGGTPKRKKSRTPHKHRGRPF